jgi:hypothetical protein
MIYADMIDDMIESNNTLRTWKISSCIAIVTPGERSARIANYHYR